MSLKLERFIIKTVKELLDFSRQLYRTQFVSAKGRFLSTSISLTLFAVVFEISARFLDISPRNRLQLQPGLTASLSAALANPGGCLAEGAIKLDHSSWAPGPRLIGAGSCNCISPGPSSPAVLSLFTADFYGRQLCSGIPGPRLITTRDVIHMSFNPSPGDTPQAKFMQRDKEN